MQYPVHETFHSWQGEGFHLGRSAYFIRLFGCPIHCPWCDSAGTWHTDFIPEHIEKRTAEDLAGAAHDSGAEFTVVTGGEPAIHDLKPLTSVLAEKGVKRHLETSGSFEITGEWDWITLSPKWQKLPLEGSLGLANEFKVIVEDSESIDKWIRTLGDKMLDDRPIWLHPEWSKRGDSEVLESITPNGEDAGEPVSSRSPSP